MPGEYCENTRKPIQPRPGFRRAPKGKTMSSQGYYRKLREYRESQRLARNARVKDIASAMSEFIRYQLTRPPVGRLLFSTPSEVRRRERLREAWIREHMGIKFNLGKTTGRQGRKNRRKLHVSPTPDERLWGDQYQKEPTPDA